MAKIIITDGEPTEENFTTALRAAVDLFTPEYVYPDEFKNPVTSTCRYADRVDSDEPGVAYQPRCIVGVALSLMGIEVPAKSEGSSASEVMSGLGFDTQIGVHASNDFGRAVNNMQNTQDDGHPWGVALQDFSISLESYRS